LRRTQPPPSTFSKGERRGSALAHGSALLIGVPLTATGFLPLSMALIPAPVVAYFIGRAFRRRGQQWGSFQGLQASLVHLMIVILVFLSSLSDDPWTNQLALTAWTVAFLLFLYTLWGAFDTFLGYDFRYMFLGRLITRVSQANARRQELRRKWLEQRRAKKDGQS